MNNFKKEKISEKVKWFLKLNPSQRHNLAVNTLIVVSKDTFKKRNSYGKRLFKTIQIIKQKQS